MLCPSPRPARRVSCSAITEAWMWFSWVEAWVTVLSRAPGCLTERILAALNIAVPVVSGIEQAVSMAPAGVPASICLHL